MKRRLFLPLLLIFSALLLAGCRVVHIEEEAPEPLEYTIVKQEDIPEDLYALILQKKQKEFRMTYLSGEDLYLVKGYGQQLTSGYSIAVAVLGVTSNAILFQTNLIGPEEIDGTGGEPSYPYIVIKTAARDEPVIFGEY